MVKGCLKFKEIREEIIIYYINKEIFMEYYNCCGTCSNCNLYEKDWSGKFYCEAKRFYVRATDDVVGCKDYEYDRRRTTSDIDKAREGRL